MKREFFKVTKGPHAGKIGVLAPWRGQAFGGALGYPIDLGDGVRTFSADEIEPISAPTASKQRRRSKPKKCVSSWDEALDYIDGKAYTLDGIHGHFHVLRTYTGPWGPRGEAVGYDSKRHTFGGMTRVMHEPSARGKRSEAYREKKRQYRDDWSSDLSESERLATEIMPKMGVVWHTEPECGGSGYG